MEDIGARLVIDPGKSLETLQALNTEIGDLDKNLARLGLTAEATMGKVTKMGEEAAVAGDAAAAGSGKAAKATEEAAVAGGAGAAGMAGATKAAAAGTASWRKELDALAAGPLGKFGKWGLLGALGVGAESVHQYMQYQKAMTQLVTQAGLAQSRLPAIMAGGLQIGKQTGLNFNDIANQLYRIVSATSGLKETNKQILALGKSAADIAVLFRVAPGAPTEQVARLFGALANAGRSGKLQQVGNTPAQMGALLNAAVGTGDIRGPDLIGALGRGVLQSGQAVGAKLPDILAWLDLSTRLGAQPSTSGTLIAHSLQQIATPSEQGTKAQMMLGIQQGQLQQIMKNQGIGQAVAFLMSSMQKFNPVANYPAMSGHTAGADSALAQLTAWGMNPSLLSAFQAGTMNPTQLQTLQQFMLTKMEGGARQEIPVLSIAENLPLYSAIEAQMAAQTNQPTYNKDLQTALNTPQQQMQIAMRNLQAYSIQIGQDLTPLVVKAAHGLVDAASWLAGHRGVLDAMGVAIGSFIALGVGVYAASKVLKIIDSMKSLFSFLNKVNPLTGGGFMKGGSIGTLDANTAAVRQNTEALLGRGGGGTGILPGGKGRPLTNEEKFKASGDPFYDVSQDATLGFVAKTLGGSLLKGGLYGLIASQVYNQFLQGTVAKHFGQRRASMVGDIVTGAAAGSAFGPEGTALGAFAGFAMAEWGGPKPFKSGMTAYQKLEQMKKEGFNVTPQELAKAKTTDAGSPTLQKAEKLTNFALLEQERQNYMQSQLGQLNTIGDYLGKNSPQYQSAYALYMDAARRFGITDKTKAMTGTGLQTEANKATFYSDLMQQQAQKKLFYSALSGGDVSQTQGKINRTEFDIKQAQALGLGSSKQVDDLKGQLQKEESHLKNIETLQATLVKQTTDIKDQKAYQQATKAAAETTNTLLSQILTSLNRLGVINPGLTVNGMPTTTSTRNTTGAGN